MVENWTTDVKDLGSDLLPLYLVVRKLWRFIVLDLSFKLINEGSFLTGS